MTSSGKRICFRSRSFFMKNYENMQNIVHNKTSYMHTTIQKFFFKEIHKKCINTENSVKVYFMLISNYGLCLIKFTCV